MANPRLILMDEVSLGLAPVVIKRIYDAFPTLLSNGCTILVVEQDVQHVLTVASHVACFLEGRIALQGRPERADQRTDNRGLLRGIDMDWLNAAVQGILLGGLYALFAVGLSLVFGTMRLTNLAHGDLTILPAYVALMLVNAFQFNPFYSIPITMVIMFIVGYLLQTGLLNFVVGKGDVAGVIVTFGISIVHPERLAARLHRQLAGS